MTNRSSQSTVQFERVWILLFDSETAKAAKTANTNVAFDGGFERAKCRRFAKFCNFVRFGVKFCVGDVVVGDPPKPIFMAATELFKNLMCAGGTPSPTLPQNTGKGVNAIAL